MSYQLFHTETPVVEKLNNCDIPVLVIHSHINEKGKMVLTKEEAALLLVELYKFVKDSL